MNRSARIYRVTLCGGAMNLLLAFKFVAGIVAGSAAMVADAVHSLSDAVTDAVVLLFLCCCAALFMLFGPPILPV